MHVGVQPLLSLHGGQQFTLLSERIIIRHHHVLLHHPASLGCPFSWPRPLCATDTQNKTSEVLRKHQRCHIDKNSLENCSRKLLVQQRSYRLWLETIILLSQIIFNISQHWHKVTSSQPSGGQIATTVLWLLSSYWLFECSNHGERWKGSACPRHLHDFWNQINLPN